MVSVSLVDAAEPVTADAVVVGLVSGPNGVKLAPGSRPVQDALGRKMLAAFTALGATGEGEEVLRVPTLGLAPFGLVVGTGLGADARNAENIRRAVGAAVRALTDGGPAHVHVAIDGPLGALAEGAELGSYRFTTYKSAAKPSGLRKITIAVKGGDGKAELKQARLVSEAVTRTRDLVNTPPNDLYPASFAARAAELAAARKLDVEVLDERALRRDGYGAILAVGAGSSRPPRLVRMAYSPARAKARVALVGKGITFDSGGLNLKTANMEWMKSDMGGAAAVLTSVAAIAALRLPVEVIATVPMAENMPSGTAYRPSDVITSRSGRTIEVANTDAEGRLVLVDAIDRACEDRPDRLIEASTLTGAQLISLGTRIIGAMGEPRWRDEVTAAGNAAGESVWAMPLPEELRSGLDSPVADIANVTGDRWGGMLVGGRFLAEFMPGELPWVHLDIAGPAWNLGAARDYTPKGATGAAVRTIIAAVQRLAAG